MDTYRKVIICQIYSPEMINISENKQCDLLKLYGKVFVQNQTHIEFNFAQQWRKLASISSDADKYFYS